LLSDKTPHYANHFTEVWRSLLLPETGTSLQARFELPAFRAWLRERLASNAGYDAMVRELLTVPLGGADGKGNVIGFGDSPPSPVAFFIAKDLMPENLAAAATRVFLGVKLECAQCHDHPFASWKRDQFWSFAAFFSGVKRQGPGEFVMAGEEDKSKREISIPSTEKIAKAKFLGGEEPTWTDGVSARQTLADWMTRPDNPYFARATVNRMWSYFFGTGLIDPVDEMAGGDHTASHPELLDELAKAFVDSKFDLKFLIKAIVSSQAYQLSSKAPGSSESDIRLFARMPLRGLTAEQLFDSVAMATATKMADSNFPAGVVIAGANPREDFITHFGTNSDKSTNFQTSILQALALMNGTLVADATDLAKSQALKGILDAPFFDTLDKKIEALYLSALSRRPTASETERLTRFVDGRLHGVKEGPERDKKFKEALADVFWVLLNSGEFMLNH
jgi:hypothetical protein